ncbi:oligosaccharide repeat unit polymerase [Bacillus sp. IITD106]|nr:oligosaccharide repeat unit polymerase [Bacillus sp. IITD106]
MISLTFYYSLLISSFIGTLLIVMNIDHHYMLTRLHNNSYRAIGFYLICYIMIFMPLTMITVSKWLNFDAGIEYKEYLAKGVETNKKNDNDFFLFIGFLTLVCTLAVTYTFLMIDKIPIFELFKGGSNLGELRIEVGREFKGNEQIRNIFAIGLPPILSFIAYIYAITTKLNKWRILFIVLFGISIVMSIYDLQKAPIFFYFLMFILLNIYIGKLKLNYKWVTFIGLLGVSLLVGLYVFVQKVTSIKEMLSYNTGPIGRLILSQISPFFLHLELFGDKANLLLGKSLPNITLRLYDIEQIRSARMVMEMYYPEKVEQGIAGVLNTIFAGEAFANFGYLGVFIGTIYIGALLQIIYITFLRLPKNPVFISLFVFFTVNIPRIAVGGFTDFILNPFWILLILLLGGGFGIIYLKNDLPNVYRTQNVSDN